MRLAGEFSVGEAPLARRFVSMLRGLGMQAELEARPDGVCEVWVVEEEHAGRAAELLGPFKDHPDAPEYQVAIRSGEARGRLEAARERQHELQNRAADALERSSARRLVTYSLMAISVAVFALVELMGMGWVQNALQITPLLDLGRGMAFRPGLVEIRHGQVWRLVTPIFLHFGLLHIVFNMMWLADLGGMLERKKGSLFLLAFVLVTACLSNAAQYAVSGPLFGGMSGVVYGMLGYVWIKGRLAPEDGLYLHPNTVTFMLIWLALGWTGMIGGIANIVHAVGLAVGVGWGVLAARGKRG